MPEYTSERYRKEEKASALTHMPGVLLSLVGTPFLLACAAEGNLSKSQWIGTALFGISMLLLYLASVVYHSVHEPGRKKLFRKLDHIAIYFLIAGTHTPFILIYLNNTKGYIYLAILWSLLLIGSVGKTIMLEKWERLSLVLYVFMGWMFLFVLPDVWPVMSGEVLGWIGVGGFFYTVGVFFFVREKLRYGHAIWHLFVLAGTGGHFVALWKALGQ